MAYECNYGIVDHDNEKNNRSWSHKACFDGLNAYIEEINIKNYTIRVYCTDKWVHENKLLYTDAEIVRWFDFLTFCQLYAHYHGEIVAEQGGYGDIYLEGGGTQPHKYYNCKVFEVHSNEHRNFKHLLATLTCVRFLYETVGNKSQIPKIAMEFKNLYPKHSFIYSLTLAHMVASPSSNHTLVNEGGWAGNSFSNPLKRDDYLNRIESFAGVHEVFGNHENVEYVSEQRDDITRFLREGKYYEVLNILKDR